MTVEGRTDNSGIVASRVNWKDLCAWFAPWAIGAVLIGAFLLGLWTASDAHDNGTYAAGMIAAGLALIGLAWDLKAYLDGTLPTILVDTAEALLILEGLLVALALGGLILAAEGEGSALREIGEALFLVCVGLIFWNMKHYFDHRDHCRSA